MIRAAMIVAWLGCAGRSRPPPPTSDAEHPREHTIVVEDTATAQVLIDGLRRWGRRNSAVECLLAFQRHEEPLAKLLVGTKSNQAFAAVTCDQHKQRMISKLFPGQGWFHEELWTGPLGLNQLRVMVLGKRGGAYLGRTVAKAGTGLPATNLMENLAALSKKGQVLIELTVEPPKPAPKEEVKRDPDRDPEPEVVQISDIYSTEAEQPANLRQWDALLPTIKDRSAQFQQCNSMALSRYGDVVLEWWVEKSGKVKNVVLFSSTYASKRANQCFPSVVYSMQFARGPSRERTLIVMPFIFEQKEAGWPTLGSERPR